MTVSNAAALLVELRLRGDYSDVFQAMGEGAQQAVKIQTAALAEKCKKQNKVSLVNYPAPTQQRARLGDVIDDCIESSLFTS
jgi:hypothetical protein